MNQEARNKLESISLECDTRKASIRAMERKAGLSRRPVAMLNLIQARKRELAELECLADKLRVALCTIQ